MKLIQYGVCLKRITIEDIELVREWRNSPDVQHRMIYREYITPEMQEKWFHSIDNYNNFYYIIEHNGKKIGLIDNKNTDWSIGTTDSGLFLVDKSYFDSYIPIAASMILMKAGFYLLGGKEASILILDSNKKAIDYNRKLGFVPIKKEKESDSTEYLLTRESFEQSTLKIREALNKLYGKQDPYYYMYLSPSDYKSGVGQEAEKVAFNLEKSMIHFMDWDKDEKVICLKI